MVKRFGSHESILIFTTARYRAFLVDIHDEVSISREREYITRAVYIQTTTISQSREYNRVCVVDASMCKRQFAREFGRSLSLFFERRVPINDTGTTALR